MSTEISELEKAIVKLTTKLEGVITNTQNLPEIMRMITITNERVNTNTRDISAISKKVHKLEIRDDAIEAQLRLSCDTHTESFDQKLATIDKRSDTRMKWILSIALGVSGMLFGYSIKDNQMMSSELKVTKEIVLINKENITDLEVSHNKKRR